MPFCGEREDPEADDRPVPKPETEQDESGNSPAGPPRNPLHLEIMEGRRNSARQASLFPVAGLWISDCVAPEVKKKKKTKTVCEARFGSKNSV